MTPGGLWITAYRGLYKAGSNLLKKPSVGKTAFHTQAMLTCHTFTTEVNDSLSNR